MFLDVQIDKLTDCLIEHSTGKLVETEYKLHHNIMPRKNIKTGNLIGIKHRKTGMMYMSYL